MDKYEYKVRSEEILNLIEDGEYAEAVEIADTIDWKKVHNYQMLCRISDLYKINRRYEDSKEILLLAYEIHPSGRLIVYSLCELSIKLGEIVQAIEYCKEFRQLAPEDPGQYILQYRIYQAGDVSLEERIAVLEELKAEDYRERWAYELAFLYHSVGLSTRCVEECDEMFLWFGEGKFVLKALELKMLHRPLNSQQQAFYEQEMAAAGIPVTVPTSPDFHGGQVKDISTVTDMKASTDTMDLRTAPQQTTDDMDIQVKPMDLGQYNTINLQRALAESMKEIMGEDEEEPEMLSQEGSDSALYDTSPQSKLPYARRDAQESSPQVWVDTGSMKGMSELSFTGEEQASAQAYMQPAEQGYAQPDGQMYGQPAQQGYAQPDGQMYGQPMEQGLSQEELAQQALVEGYRQQLSGVQQFVPEDPIASTPTGPIYNVGGYGTEKMPIVHQVPVANREPVVSQSTRVWNANDVNSQLMTQETRRIPTEEIAAFEQAQRVMEQMKQESTAVAAATAEATASVPGSMTGKIGRIPTDASKFDHMLSQDADGQLSLAVPESHMVEKQITGQLSLDDIMAEWEKTKQENEQKRMKEVRQRILQHTGSLFDDFDEATKNGLLEQLEKAFVEAIMKESEGISPYQGGELGRRINEEARRAADRQARKEEILYEEEPIEDYEDEDLIERDPEAEEEAYEEEPIEGYEDEDLIEGDPEAEEEANEEESEEGYEEDPMEGDPEAEEEAYEEESEEDYGEEPEEDEELSEDDPEEQYEEDAYEEDSESIRRVKAAMEDDEDERASQKPKKKEQKAETKEHSFSDEEKEIFGDFLNTRRVREQILTALDQMSMAAYTGNVLITGGEGTGTMDLARALLIELGNTESNFMGQKAMVSGGALNRKDVGEILAKLDGGALIVKAASEMSDETALQLVKALDTEAYGVIVILEDEKELINELMDAIPELAEGFNVRIDLESLNDDALVDYAQEYAREQEYSIDSFAILALHRRIDEMQTLEHEVTIAEIRELVDQAIYYARKKTPKHLMDVIFSKRYDKDDMIILREEDFEHY